MARLVLGELFGPTLPFATFFPAVLVSALFGGAVAGVLSIGLSILAVWWAFTRPFYEFEPITPVLAANFFLFAFSGLLMVWLAVNHRRLLTSLAEKEEERKLLVREVQHRDKNIVAVVLSLIWQTVRDKDEASKLVSRIKVVVDTRNILDDTDTRTVTLETILRERMLDRVTLDGPEALLSAPQANTLRLVFHELATNAVKYGALSRPNGRVTITWSFEDARLKIVWCERDGPKVAAPTAHNFGSRLVTRSLKHLGAEFEPAFPETGYCYTIKLPIAAGTSDESTHAAGSRSV
jgi:two-component sensor histidine kinase